MTARLVEDYRENITSATGFVFSNPVAFSFLDTFHPIHFLVFLKIKKAKTLKLIKPHI